MKCLKSCHDFISVLLLLPAYAIGRVHLFSQLSWNTVLETNTFLNMRPQIIYHCVKKKSCDSLSSSFISLPWRSLKSVILMKIKLSLRYFVQDSWCRLFLRPLDCFKFSEFSWPLNNMCWNAQVHLDTDFLKKYTMGPPYPWVSYPQIQLTRKQSNIFIPQLGIHGCGRLTVCTVPWHFM